MKSVVFCGSSRFADEMRKFSTKVGELGAVTFMPHLYRASGGVWANLNEFDQQCVALGLTHDHFYKIDQADVVFIFNKNGYAGCSTSMEIGYAVAKGKTLYALEGDDEVCRNVLYKDIVSTPEALFNILSK